jgi:hypothetical protein
VTRRRSAVVAGAVLVAVALVAFARWEGRRAADEQLDGIDRARALAGARLDSASLSAYRITTHVDCLLYRLEDDPYALELCFDERARLIEAIDRRGSGEPRIWSVRYRPGDARVRPDAAALFRVFRELGAFPRETPFDGAIPLAPSLYLPPEELAAPGDTGPRLVRRDSTAQ